MTNSKEGKPDPLFRALSKKRGVVLVFSAILLLLAYPLLGMLWHHAYPVLSPEVGLLGAMAVASAFVMAFFVTLSRPTVGNLVITGVMTLAFTIHFNLEFLGLCLVLSLGLVLGLLLKERYSQLVLAVIAAMVVGSWLDNRLEPATKLSNLQPFVVPDGRGPVLHILMDGFMAPDGLPQEEAPQELRNEIISFFRKHGFELHTRAYSHYNSTLDSMTRALNFRNDDANLFQRANLLREDLEFRDNTWFEVLEQAGYTIHVYQSESLDFCDVPAVKNIHCNVFPIPSLKTVHRKVGSVRLRAEVLVRTLASQSAILTKILRDARILDTWGVSIYDERLLPKLADDLQIRPGDAFFAHVLIPHSPFVFSEDCSIDYEGESWTRWAYVLGTYAGDLESLRIRYEKYIAQSRCAMTLLGRLFDKMKSAGLYNQATIIVHGDHGSSVQAHPPSVRNLNRLTKHDLLASFSTLFAVKWPGGEHEIVSEVESLNVLMARAAGKVANPEAGKSAIDLPPEPEPFVYLTDGELLRPFYINIFGGPAREPEQD